MTPAQLTAIGRALHGERWQAPLARDIGVAPRTVRRWAKGAFGIPDTLEAELRQLLTSRARDIETIVKGK